MQTSPRFLVAILFVAGLAPFVTPLAAQSLADVARKEEERRKEVKAPAKVYTNRDLRDAPPVTQPPTTSTSPGAPTSKPAAGAQTEAERAEAADDDADAKPSGPAAAVKDQAYWAGRMQGLQTQLDRDQSFADALQTRVNSLTTDFVNRDNPVQRAELARERQKALDEIARLKLAIQNDTKAIADLQEEARRAGVPPGWLR